MGFLDKFFKSFDDEVAEALDKIRVMGLGVTKLGASVNDKVVTLVGNAPDMKTKAKVMQAFNELVKTDNTINNIKLPEVVPPTKEILPEPVVEEKAEQVYEVVSGDTLGGIAKRFYGNAGQYMKIFEANRDILDDPNLIKVGQKLTIPE
jgi:LysM repeat protein